MFESHKNNILEFIVVVSRGEAFWWSLVHEAGIIVMMSVIV